MRSVLTIASTSASSAYDGGGLCYGVTGWGTHSYDQIPRALGTDETGPVEMVLEEAVEDRPCGKFETVTEVDETRLDYLLRLAKPVVGPRAKVRMWYANGTELRLHLDGDWGPGWARFSSAKMASWKSNATRSREIPRNSSAIPAIPAATSVLLNRSYGSSRPKRIESRSDGRKTASRDDLLSSLRDSIGGGGSVSWDSRPRLTRIVASRLTCSDSSACTT